MRLDHLLSKEKVEAALLFGGRGDHREKEPRFDRKSRESRGPPRNKVSWGKGAVTERSGTRACTGRAEAQSTATWGCSSVGRAPALQAGGQEFESLHLHCPVSIRVWETPVPIPNTTVKPYAAEGTLLETARETRWMPDIVIITSNAVSSRMRRMLAS